jgi:hypothetical protein
MSIIEAIQKSNALVLQRTGVQADPSFVRLVERPGGRRAWRLVYEAKLFLPKEEQGEDVVIDGGEYIVEVDQATGLASVVGL